MNGEPTIQDVLDVLHTFSGNVDERFDRVDKRFGEMDERLSDMDERFGEMDGRLGQMRAVMVTKDYLDTKLADLRGDLITITRKGNTKFSALIDELVDSKQMDQNVAAKLLAMEPFPRT